MDPNAAVDSVPPAGGPVMDMLVRQGAAAREVDLVALFGEGLTFSAETSDGDVADATIGPDGVLTLDFGALGHADIRVTATDAEGRTAAGDAFRVRVAGEDAYTIAVLPDTQDYTDDSLENGPPETFYRMTEWLAANKEAHNIQFVAHVGDITQDNLASNWVVAERAMRRLDGEIPYSLLPGNHDQALGGTAADHSTEFLDALFPPAAQAATNPDTFGGVYDQEPDRSANNYHTFTAPDGTRWLVLSIEFGPRDDVLRWAGDVIEAHLDHRVMLLSHALTNWASRHDAAGAPLYDEGAGNDYGMRNDPEGANDGEAVYRQLLSRYPNVTFTFSGHIFGDGAETNVSYSQHGNPVHETLVNYQNGVAREITGNGDPELGGRGGNGAIRLVVVDPENDRISTQTYFVELDDYLDGFRDKPELDRDGLTGPYRGHEEVFEDVEVGTPEPRALAKAGDDLVVDAAEGEAAAAVALDGTGTLDPAGDAESYTWTDRDGRTVATGESTNAEFGVGRHVLTLTVADADGRETTDTKTVIVRGDGTLLVETFDDGDLDGWSRPAPDALEVGAPTDFGLPDLPGGGAESVVRVPALAPSEGLLVNPNLGAPAGTLIGSYSLVFDILVPAEADQGTWTSFLQTNTANTDDGELFIQNRGDGTGGIGIAGDYTGEFRYGEWQRVAFVFEESEDGTSATLSKYIEGEKAGEQTVTGDRFKLDASRGALLFSDENGETSELYASSVLLTDKAFTDAEVAALGGAQAGGIAEAAPTPASVQFDFGDAELGATFGPATLSFGEAGAGAFLVKGTVFSRPEAEPGLPAPEGRLFEQSDTPGNVLSWDAPEALSWSDYVLGATLRSTDNDTIGVVFNYRDADNHYRLTLDGEVNRRELVKAKDGVETVLASVADGLRFDADMRLEVSTVDGRIDAFLDGRSIFGGPTYDLTDPLEGGTVGVYSSDQRVSIFDDIVVNRASSIATAGEDVRVLDLDGDGSERVALDGGASVAPGGVAGHAWTVAEGGPALGEEARLEVELGAGVHRLDLAVTGADGSVDTDRVRVEVVAREDVLLSESFGSPAALDAWRIVDEGEFGGVGPDGTDSNWALSAGRLVQTSDLASRQLEWQGASSEDVWQRGWSPLGDGVNVLRRGTYAVYDEAEAAGWTDYSLEATIRTPDDDGLGFLFRYVDADNHYKLELDASGVYDRDPRNGAGSLFTLTRVLDGVEDILSQGQVPARYEPGQDMRLRVDVEGGVITAYHDGEAIFALPIEDRELPQGTVALYSWGSAGVAFDDVAVVRISAEERAGATPGADTVVGGPEGERIAGLDGGDALRGRGGEGADLLDGGPGADRLRGGPGPDVFVLRRGEIADPAADGGRHDLIADLAGAGSDGAEDDLLRLVGLGPDAALAHVGGSGGPAGTQTYRVTDGDETAEVFVRMSGDPAARLAPGDYTFVA